MSRESFSDLQHKKMKWWFHVYDSNQSGYLDKDDFYDYLNKWDEIFSLDQKPEIKQGLHDIQTGFWQLLLETVDKNDDGVISLEEWLDWLSDLAPVLKSNYDETGEIPYADWGNLTYDLMDDDGSGEVSSAEYFKYISSLRADEGDAKFAWSKFDPQQKGYITRDEFLSYLCQFWLSEDSSEAGNYFLAPPRDLY